MHRRNILAGFAAAGGLIGAALGSARAETFAAAPVKMKVVYHLNELGKVDFVLGNIRNHIDGMGGADKVTIALVVHGPALKAFHAASANPETRRKLGGFSNIELAACGNTMKAQEITLKDLLPGFAVDERGGVVRIAELQMQGYAYLRP
jgi:intracellular sulfur oxidation DsrE/DsrF family protein